MEIIINGETVALEASIDTVEKLIAHLDLASRRFFIVEKNREVVKKDDYAKPLWVRVINLKSYIL